MSGTKLVVQTLLFPTKKKFDWFRSWQYGLIESNICAKTFAPHVSLKWFNTWNLPGYYQNNTVRCIIIRPLVFKFH